MGGSVGGVVGAGLSVAVGSEGGLVGWSSSGGTAVTVVGWNVNRGLWVGVLVTVGVGEGIGVGVMGSSWQCPGPATPLL